MTRCDPVTCDTVTCDGVVRRATCDVRNNIKPFTLYGAEKPLYSQRFESMFLICGADAAAQQEQIGDSKIT